MPNYTEQDDGAWGSRAKVAFAVFAIVGGLFLFSEHRAHVLSYLPWLILLACPLMHVFMHGGHGRHHGAGDRPQNGSGGFTGTKREAARDGDAGSKGESHSQH